jgi:hypothetical protein
MSEIEPFPEGAISGILTGVAIKTSIDASETGIAIMVLKAFCQVAQYIIKSSSSCWEYVSLLSLFAAVMSIIMFIRAVSSVDDWRVGLFLYGIGFIMGLGLILFFA